MSTFTLLPANKTEDVNLMYVLYVLKCDYADGRSVIGGALMVIVGLLYLAFEDFVLGDFTWPEKRASPKQDISRILIGIQIGLILLAILVTRSSALSLQAKLGLPRGNQVLGWAVLGQFRNIRTRDVALIIP